jgi:hypothetical protein
MKFVRIKGRIVPIKKTAQSLKIAEALQLSSTLKGLKSPTLRKNFSLKIKDLLKKCSE